MQSKKIVITGGHLAPALAVISELQKRSLPAGRQGDWEIYYLGRKTAMEESNTSSVESRVIPTLGVEFIPISTGRLQRRFTRYTIPSLLRIPLGFFQALVQLRRIKPDVICSFGGYVSVPVVVVGKLLRIPILTHEQTVVFGLASKINSFFADKVAVSFKESLAHFPKSKVVLTGNPIREEIFQFQKPSWFQPPVSNFQFRTIYITGGNQGSSVINSAVLEILPKLLEKFIVIHQCGDFDYGFVDETTATLGQRLKERYFLSNFVSHDEIGWVLSSANLIISRAGINTVCEIAILGRPAIFIPIPWSFQDEQAKNAKMLVEAGIAEILPQSQLSGKTLLEKISQMMENLEKYQKNAQKAKSLITLDGGKRLVDEIVSLKR